jgi:predicted ABC-type ATPase
LDFFNADDRAAKLNNGSYHGISPEIRSRVNREFEQFINSHIQGRRSLAFETTLRTDITLRQAGAAKEQGFRVTMKYIAIGNLEEHLERVASRWDAGGHAASESTLRKIYEASLRNLPAALRAIEFVEVWTTRQLVRSRGW